VTGETFGQMLRRLRIVAGLSQYELARRAGCDPSYVNILERRGAGSKMGRSFVLAFAEALDVSQPQADRLLFAAGLAPQEDWQTRALRAEIALSSIRQAFDDAVASDDEELLVFRRRAV
jgi:transcriptional regulator with XRE-family HTH domain